LAILAEISLPEEKKFALTKAWRMKAVRNEAWQSWINQEEKLWVLSEVSN